MVEFADQHREKFSHRFSKVLIILQVLHDRDLSGDGMALMLDGESDGFVNARTD